MRTSSCIAALSLCLAVGAACAQQSPTATTSLASKPGSAVAIETVKASAVVTAVDRPNRILTVKMPDGSTNELVASKDVRNFDQIAVKDQIVVEYTRALSLELRKAGAPRQSASSAGAVRAPQGEKPAGAIGQSVSITADVTDVDPQKKTITLKGPKGKVVVLDVQNPDQFKVVKKGDQVDVDYVEAVAVSVQKAPAK
jgi:hypothetical protein